VSTRRPTPCWPTSCPWSSAADPGCSAPATAGTLPATGPGPPRRPELQNRSRCNRSHTRVHTIEQDYHSASTAIGCAPSALVRNSAMTAVGRNHDDRFTSNLYITVRSCRRWWSRLNATKELVSHMDTCDCDQRCRGSLRHFSASPSLQCRAQHWRSSQGGTSTTPGFHRELCGKAHVHSGGSSGRPGRHSSQALGFETRSRPSGDRADVSRDRVSSSCARPGQPLRPSPHVVDELGPRPHEHVAGTADRLELSRICAMSARSRRARSQRTCRSCGSKGLGYTPATIHTKLWTIGCTGRSPGLSARAP
jgi:hypothetical protein